MINNRCSLHKNNMRSCVIQKHLKNVYPHPRTFLKKIYLFMFGERRQEGEREGEKHQSVASHAFPAGDLAGNPGRCLDGELNPVTF